MFQTGNDGKSTHDFTLSYTYNDPASRNIIKQVSRVEQLDKLQEKFEELGTTTQLDKQISLQPGESNLIILQPKSSNISTPSSDDIRFRTFRRQIPLSQTIPPTKDTIRQRGKKFSILGSSNRSSLNSASSGSSSSVSGVDNQLLNMYLL